MIFVWFMISYSCMDNLEKERDYRSRTFNFGGFALMTPLGHLVIDPATLFDQFNIVGFFLYAIFCLVLFVMGFCFIEIGRDILYNKR